MLSRDELFAALKGIVETKGLNLFDIDYPTLASPTLRVVIWRLGNSADSLEDSQVVETSLANAKERVRKRGVNLDECAAVSRDVSEWLEQNDFGGPDMLLEVSSPGVNRRLRSPDQFATAVGERVKLKVRAEGADQKLDSVIGELLEVGEGYVVLLHQDNNGAKGSTKKGRRSPSLGKAVKLTLPFSRIEEAKVDFAFS